MPAKANFERGENWWYTERAAPSDSAPEQRANEGAAFNDLNDLRDLSELFDRGFLWACLAAVGLSFGVVFIFLAVERRGRVAALQAKQASSKDAKKKAKKQ